jgi:phosphoglycolate phosphatase-like HAD superfamily hydrolase
MKRIENGSLIDCLYPAEAFSAPGERPFAGTRFRAILAAPHGGSNMGSVLILDFDGVICDSIDECFASSWTAYHRLYKGSPNAEPSPQARASFAWMRPFIRTGEDFVIIQDLLWRREDVRDQAGFDEAARQAGPSQRELFRKLFYQARTELLERDRAAWLGLNRIYPHMAEAFTLIPPGAPLYILSTKKPRFIAEILAAHGISVTEERIVLSETEPKLLTAEAIRVAGDFEKAILVEDQIDAIRGNSNPAIQVFLASWGYVQREWITPPLVVPVLDPPGFLRLITDGEWSLSTRMSGG